MTCRHCGTPLTRKPGETVYNYRKRKFCDRACHQAERARVAAIPVTKTCPECGIQFTQLGGKASDWRRRRTCSRHCAVMARWHGCSPRDRIEEIEWLLGGGESPWQIPARLDTTAQALVKMLRGQRRLDLAAHFYQAAEDEKGRAA